MTAVVFFRLIIGKLKWLILFPALLALAVVFFTRNISKEYQSAATVYTGLASGYNITDDGTEKVDNYKVNNAFDNLIATVKSKETLEEAAILLLAQHLLLKGPDRNILGDKGFYSLDDFLPEIERQRITVPNSFEKTVERIHTVRDSSTRNVVQYILSNPGSFYSLSTLQENVKVSRKLNSDMLEVTYVSSDPGVSFYTVKYLLDIFKNKFKNLKGGETGTAVKYFEDQVHKAYEDLQKVESELQDFGVENKIINYAEQAKAVSESKEALSTDYYKEKMRNQAAAMAIERIEEKMNNYSDFVSSNEELINIRQSLSSLNYKLTNAKLSESSSEKIAKIEDEIETLKLKLKEKARDYYNFNNSIEWVPQNTLLNEWLAKVVEEEESKGRLKVFEQRLGQYDDIYREFAPLGSIVNKLERDVSLAEKQYLSVLNGLNLAKLRQQNIDLSNDLRVIDKPYYPLQPLPSKRLLLVALSLVAGFVLLLSYYVVMELANSSIRYPERVEQITGLPLLSALSWVEPKKKNKLAYDEVQTNIIQQILNSVFIELKKTDPRAGNYIIAVFSTKEKEGKTYFSEQLVNKLCRVKNKVLYLYPNTSKDHGKYIDLKSPKILEYEYEVNEEVIDYQGIFDFISNSKNIPQNPDEVSYTVLELPALNKYPIPANLIAKAHVNLMVVHAQRAWTSSDKHLLKTYRAMASNSIQILLNKVGLDSLESIYGEIPKNRSLARRKIKSVFVGEQSFS